MSDTALATFDLTSMEQMAERIKQLKAFMDKNLEKGIDWENTHEVFKKELKPNEQAKPMLLDPGCAKIMNFMGVRPRHRVLEMQIDKEGGNLRYVVAVEIVTYLPVMYHNAVTQSMDAIYPVVAEGLGSSTTREKRYKVRFEWWTERSLKVDGYTDADLEDYRTKYPDRFREGKPNNLYYMASSEALGLDNTLIKMAAKRAAMDAVFQLPGVAGRYSQEVDLLEAQTGEREPKPLEKPAEPAVEHKTQEPAENEAAVEERDGILTDIMYEFPESSADDLMAQAKTLMEESNGLYTTINTALKVLWKRLKQQSLKAEAPASPAEKPKPEAKPKSETPPAAKPPEKAVTPKDAPSETITSKDGTVLGRLVVEGTDARFTPEMSFTVDTPPFKSFLVDRVLQGMVDADAQRVEAGELTEGMDFEVTEDNYTITRIDITNYGGERRLNEISSSLRWTFDKMLDKAKEIPPRPRPEEEQPEPSFRTAGGEAVMGSEEVKARAAVDGLLGSDQLEYVVVGGVLKVTPKKSLGDAWKGINDAWKPLGASWVQVKPNHWEIPVKAAKAWPKVVGLESREVEDIIAGIQSADPKVSKAMILEKMDVEIAKAAGLLTKEAAAHMVASQYLSEPEKHEGLSIESVEEYLTKAHGDLANQRLAVTENSTFIMVEPYQSLTPTEQAAFDKTMKVLGAEYKGDKLGWFLTKPKGGGKK